MKMITVERMMVRERERARKLKEWKECVEADRMKHNLSEIFQFIHRTLLYLILHMEMEQIAM